jgi:hypothetical protein
VHAQLLPDIESIVQADSWDAFGARLHSEGAMAVWFVQALPGLHWNVADGIDVGISAEVVFG